MRKLLMTSFVATALVMLTSPALYAQSSAPTAVSDQDLQLLRKDLRSMKKQLVAANMQLTDAEAEKFWPIYDQYSAETAKNYDARYALIKDYAANFSNMTDAQAQTLSKRSADIDGAMIQLRQKYLPLFGKAIPGKKTALFFQIDRRLALIMDLQLASEIPLVQQ
jgi:hypothetical protein